MRKFATQGGLVVVGLWLLSACFATLESKSAGHIGCLPSEVKVRAESEDGGFMQSVTTWIAACKGHEYVCTEVLTSGEDATNSQVHCQPRQTNAGEPSQVEAQSRQGTPTSTQSARLAPDGPPPVGAAGFEFGVSVVEARSSCESAGHSWTEASSNAGLCSGSPQPLGFAAKVLVQFCDGKSCGLAVIHRPESRWADSWVGIYRALSSKYGESMQRDVALPQACLTEARFAECVASGRAKGGHKWKWQTGERVHYGLLKGPRTGDDGTGPAIQIVYLGPETSTEVAPPVTPAPAFDANPAAL